MSPAQNPHRALPHPGSHRSGLDFCGLHPGDLSAIIILLMVCLTFRRLSRVPPSTRRIMRPSLRSGATATSSFATFTSPHSSGCFWKVRRILHKCLFSKCAQKNGLANIYLKIMHNFCLRKEPKKSANVCVCVCLAHYPLRELQESFKRASRELQERFKRH